LVEKIRGLTGSEARERGLGNGAKIRTGRSYWDIARANLFTAYSNLLFGIGVALIALGRYYDAATSPPRTAAYRPGWCQRWRFLAPDEQGPAWRLANAARTPRGCAGVRSIRYVASIRRHS
jgi:hypothetical protein